METTRFSSANALAQLAAGLVLGEPSEKLAHRLFASLAPALDLDTYVHYVRDPGASCLTLAGWHGISAEQAASIGTLAIGEAVCGMVAQRGEPQSVADIASTTEPRFGLLRGFGLSAYVCHPLLARADVLGTLSFGSRTRRSFDHEEVSLLRTASDILAAGLARSRAETAAGDAEAAARTAGDEQRRLAGLVEQLEHGVDDELPELRERLTAAERRADQLQHALDSRVVIEQAKGILAERHGIGVHEAFEGLRRYARSGQRSIHLAAREVVEGTADPDALR